MTDAADRLGAFDLVLSSVGWADMRPLAETDDDSWARTVATNLIGPTRLLSDVLPALAPEGIVAVLSSETVSRPRRDLVPYAASKAAGEAALAGLRLEHPGTRVSCVVAEASRSESSMRPSNRSLRALSKMNTCGVATGP